MKQIILITLLFCIEHTVLGQHIEINIGGLYLHSKPQLDVGATILTKGNTKQLNKGLQLSAATPVFKQHYLGFAYHFMRTEAEIINFNFEYNASKTKIDASLRYNTHVISSYYRYNLVLYKDDKDIAFSVFPTVDVGLGVSKNIYYNEVQTITTAQQNLLYQNNRVNESNALLLLQAHIGAGAAIVFNETIRLFSGYKYNFNTYDFNTWNAYPAHKIYTRHSYLYVGCGILLKPIKPKVDS
jgi:hypothetical protein